MKIWWGAASLPCDPVTARGVAVQVLTTQAANIEPYVLLRLRGEQTFLKENKEIISYVPVSKYLNMQSIETDGTIVTTGGFNAFVNSDPASYDYSEPRWSNSFKGRSLAAANWELIIEDFATYAEDIDWSKVSDINLYFETMAMQLPVE
jgi:hypothetical protein